MKQRVRDAALRLGLDRVGFCAADALTDDELRLRRWVAEERHGRMGYLARDPSLRADPRRLLPGARTAVVAAVPYGPAPEPSVAAYARLDDYHRAIADRLTALDEAVRSLDPTSEGLVCVDTKPVLERALAARAGLGWIGKNTMLLDVERGPWVMLGVLLTTAAIAPDAPEKDRCGTCTACLDACPTDAFVAPYVLDARRCLSYWTIEHRGPHPEWIREAQGDRIFGCDDCLAACPFGPPETLAGDPVLPVAPELARLTATETIRRVEDGFGRNFKRFAISRAGRAGLLRNALTALAHRDEPAARETCRTYVDHEDEGVRTHARWALDRLGAAP